MEIFFSQLMFNVSLGVACTSLFQIFFIYYCILYPTSDLKLKLSSFSGPKNVFIRHMVQIGSKSHVDLYTRTVAGPHHLANRDTVLAGGLSVNICLVLFKAVSEYFLYSEVATTIKEPQLCHDL